MLTQRQGASADETEIGREFFVLETPDRSPSLAKIGFKGDAAHMLLFGNADAKFFVAGAKNGAKDAVAGG
jgi:hypothetical protein